MYRLYYSHIELKYNIFIKPLTELDTIEKSFFDACMLLKLELMKKQNEGV
ncbi:hypothetical protein H5J22_02560 [Cetobacterium sp. 8H]|nr:hypothetical protein [Cetobacterium sp. 8H]MBC2850325.1 hypothetical protein [Cetobacterium sp. 8H]